MYSSNRKNLPIRCAWCKKTFGKRDYYTWDIRRNGSVYHNRCLIAEREEACNTGSQPTNTTPTGT